MSSIIHIKIIDSNVVFYINRQVYICTYTSFICGHILLFCLDTTTKPLPIRQHIIRNNTTALKLGVSY